MFALNSASLTASVSFINSLNFSSNTILSASFEAISLSNRWTL
jgi:hypothetical protein